jgi:hypothetical protein
MDIETETDMETETEIETGTETENTRTWTWPRTRTWTWNWHTFAKCFIWRNCPYSAIWNVFEISRHNFQWRYIFIAPLHNENNDMKIFKNSYRCWNIFPNDVFAELEISVWG